MRTLSDRVAVVTGAASGIGRALALALAERGAALALVDVDAAGLADSAARVRAAGRACSTHLVDVADRAAMLALPEAVVAAHGHVHVLVNNAGVALDGRFEELPLDDVAWLLGVNLWGVIHGCHAFLPLLRREGEAHIVNISSVFGIIGVPENSAYCASKYAVRGFSESLAVELAGSHIGVTCVHPGGVRTNIARRARLRDERRRAMVTAEFDRVARMSPERAAARIVRAIERGTPRLRLGPETYVLDWAKRLAPVATQRLLVGAYRRAKARLGDVPAGQTG
ncbi:MAG TPA: SDR family NAD(P)-dependent oxidoreductase [Candidatus Limnocylindria bacterium]|nr:SDR family NAD(P)-dependent oxidoreductase [Candidatus Limnocylindria bacterium]